jgi:hypothetical protein
LSSVRSIGSRPRGSFAVHAGTGAGLAVVAALSVFLATHTGIPSVGFVAGVAVGVPLVIWMFAAENMDRPLIALLLYLGLLDGFLKLRSGSTAVTLLRDVLLYAILLGWLARAVLRRERVQLPPLSGWILAWTAAVLIQVVNPGDTGTLHTLAALRPHLEFVPLFFVGYTVMRSSRRLQVLFFLLLVIATANGIVGLIQLNLTPAQLSSWGPGYAFRITGTGTGLNHVASRTFVTNSGVQRVRPPGLGSDEGVGAVWGMLSIAGGLALLSLGRLRAFGSKGRWLLLLCVGPPLAIVSGEARSYLVGSILAIFAYVYFATSVRRLIPTLTSVIVGLAVILGVVAYIGSVSGSSVFQRYLTITPSKLTATTSEDRGSSFDAIPKLIIDHPLGDGLGSSGPAAGFAGGGNAGANGETQPGFLLSETGIPGLIIFYGFNVNLLLLAVRRTRYLDPSVRPLIAAVLAGFVALLIVGITANTSAISPNAPFLWFGGGTLAYWLTEGFRTRSAPSVDSNPAEATRAVVPA